MNNEFNFNESDDSQDTDSDNYEQDIITLIDDQGRRSDFKVLDAIETDEGRFVALLPLASYDEDSGEGEYIILQVVNAGDEEELAEIEDEELLEALADVFFERFDELYEAEEL